MAALLALAGTAFRRHQAEVSACLLSPGKTLCLVERGDEAGGSDDADTRYGAQTRQYFVAFGQRRQLLVGLLDLLIQTLQQEHQRSDLRA
jgi:hypothetical protein